MRVAITISVFTAAIVATASGYAASKSSKKAEYTSLKAKLSKGEKAAKATASEKKSTELTPSKRKPQQAQGAMAKAVKAKVAKAKFSGKVKCGAKQQLIFSGTPLRRCVPRRRAKQCKEGQLRACSLFRGGIQCFCRSRPSDSADTAGLCPIGTKWKSSCPQGATCVVGGRCVDTRSKGKKTARPLTFQEKARALLAAKARAQALAGEKGESAPAAGIVKAAVAGGKAVKTRAKKSSPTALLKKAIAKKTKSQRRFRCRAGRRPLQVLCVRAPCPTLCLPSGKPVHAPPRSMKVKAL